MHNIRLRDDVIARAIAKLPFFSSQAKQSISILTRITIIITCVNVVFAGTYNIISAVLMCSSVTRSLKISPDDGHIIL